MTKHHWRQQIKSFFESHDHLDKHEQLKQSRKDMEEKKEKMIKLIKDGNDGKNESLMELITDYHKQYESLYEFYHNLTGELKKKVHKKNEEDKEKYTSSSSDSDSDSDKDHNSKEKKNRKLQNELKQRIIELEESVSKKENEKAILHSKLQEKETEASSKISGLNTEIGQLKAELEVMRVGKRQFESKLETVSKLENENAELRSKVVDLELNIRSAERKADELSKGNQSHDQLVIELQTTIDDLKRDLEMDKDEITTIEEKNRNLEVMLRLSNQKLRVTEQLLSEKEGSHKQLAERNATFSQIIKQLNAYLAEFEDVITKKLNASCGRLDRSVFTLSKEVKSVKSWVAVSRSEKDVRNLAMQLDKVKAENEEMEKAMKEKDERISSLGEEKREAIRQLCVWAGYYRGRRAEVHGVLLSMDS